MKTAKEKAEYWLDDNVSGWHEGQLKCLTVLLKEQDRDTRHACAEASLQCGTVEGAHDACMNAKAV